jgi:hypothetical protein
VAQRMLGLRSGRRKASGGQPSPAAKRRKRATARKKTGGSPLLPPPLNAGAQPGAFIHCVFRCDSYAHNTVEGRPAERNRLEQLFVATWSSSPNVEVSGSRNYAGNDNGLEYTWPSRSQFRFFGFERPRSRISFTHLKTR